MMAWALLDLVLAVIAVFALALDWYQTRIIARDPAHFFERNPLLGTHPTVGRVNSYFALVLIVLAVIAYALQPGWRTAFLFGAAVFEAIVVWRNWTIGLK